MPKSRQTEEPDNPYFPRNCKETQGQLGICKWDHIRNETYVFACGILTIAAQLPSSIFIGVGYVARCALQEWLCKSTACAVCRELEVNQLIGFANHGTAGEHHGHGSANPVGEGCDVVHSVLPEHGHLLRWLEDSVEELAQDDEEGHEVCCNHGVRAMGVVSNVLFGHAEQPGNCLGKRGGLPESSDPLAPRRSE